MFQNPFWYSENPFYQSGVGLPNCTCYAWGRRYEITNKKPNTSLHNANTWYLYNIENNVYSYGSEPRLGAIICFDGNETGHVGIVEEIIDNDTIVTSNSNYGAEYFVLYTLRRSNNWNLSSNLHCQGFIYLDDEPIPPKPIKRRKRNIFPILYQNIKWKR